jgi:hypothetical protein
VKGEALLYVVPSQWNISHCYGQLGDSKQFQDTDPNLSSEITNPNAYRGPLNLSVFVKIESVGVLNCNIADKPSTKNKGQELSNVGPK